MRLWLLSGSDIAVEMKMINAPSEDGAMERGDCGSKDNIKLDTRLEPDYHYQR